MSFLFSAELLLLFPLTNSVEFDEPIFQQQLFLPDRYPPIHIPFMPSSDAINSNHFLHEFATLLIQIIKFCL